MTRTVMKKTVLGAVLTLEKDFEDGTIYFAVDGRRTGKTFSSIRKAIKWVTEEVIKPIEES